MFQSTDRWTRLASASLFLLWMCTNVPTWSGSFQHPQEMFYRAVKKDIQFRTTTIYDKRGTFNISVACCIVTHDQQMFNEMQHNAKTCPSVLPPPLSPVSPSCPPLPAYSRIRTGRVNMLLASSFVLISCENVQCLNCSGGGLTVINTHHYRHIYFLQQWTAWLRLRIRGLAHSAVGVIANQPAISNVLSRIYYMKNIYDRLTIQ